MEIGQCLPKPSTWVHAGPPCTIPHLQFAQVASLVPPDRIQKEMRIEEWPVSSMLGKLHLHPSCTNREAKGRDPYMLGPSCICK